MSHTLSEIIHYLRSLGITTKVLKLWKGVDGISLRIIKDLAGTARRGKLQRSAGKVKLANGGNSVR